MYAIIVNVDNEGILFYNLLFAHLKLPNVCLFVLSRYMCTFISAGRLMDVGDSSIVDVEQYNTLNFVIFSDSESALQLIASTSATY